MELEFGDIRTLAVSPSGRQVGIVYVDASRTADSPVGLRVVDSVSGTVFSEWVSAGSGNQHRSVGFLANGARILNHQGDRGWNLTDWKNQQAELLSRAGRGPVAISEDERVAVVGSRCFSWKASGKL